ncbi:hypothetical protein EG329_007988 [Mollisiaceae sp. DMI_Dod_QoI]|nr:hypothetical protein EG329_007988 [Helotiales sp. DMI_Dod_QoI]
MKIIDISTRDVATRRREREALLDREIRRLEKQLASMCSDVIQFKESEDQSSPVPYHLKPLYIDRLELTIKLMAARDLGIFNPPKSTPPPTFTCFSDLPIELRFKIWDYTFEDHRRERVHCIDISKPHRKYYDQTSESSSIAPGPDRNPTFISNQPIHPILHTCHESRQRYISRTSSELAFGTYINFNFDIVYIPYLPHTDTTFHLLRAFQACAKIQRLAMSHRLYCHLPNDEEKHMSTQHIEMQEDMPEWRETLIVFEDEERFDEFWTDKIRGFVELSARQKRLNCARGYARQYTKTLNSMIETMADMEPMKYRFVEPGRNEVYRSWDQMIELESEM